MTLPSVDFVHSTKGGVPQNGCHNRDSRQLALTVSRLVIFISWLLLFHDSFKISRYAKTYIQYVQTDSTKGLNVNRFLTYFTEPSQVPEKKFIFEMQSLEYVVLCISMECFWGSHPKPYPEI